MTAVVEMESGDISPPKFKVTENVEIESAGAGDKQCKLHESKSDIAEIDCSCETDGALGKHELKIDIEATSVLEKECTDKDKIKTEESDSALSTNGTKTASCTVLEEFSEEKDAPEVSHRVYDFNMVKQKTLPRISFGNNGILKAFSSHSKSYIIMWTLMPISIAICVIILVLYWVG